MENTTTQNRQVLKHLITKGPLTSWECIQTYKYTRLSARIGNLEEMGFQIKHEVMKNDSGKGYHIRYSILEKGTPEFLDRVKRFLG